MPTTIRSKPGQMTAIKRVQRDERRKSQSATIGVLIDDGLEAHGLYHFNRACTLLGITAQREAFSKWRRENEVPTYATMPEWQDYAEEFETDGDERDLRDTQNDASGTP